VDAERTAASLEAAGWSRADEPERAGLLVVTTCAFIDAAMEESVELILEIAAAREEWQLLAVLGCLVTREGDRLAELIPEVDIFLDVDSMDRLAEVLEDACGFGAAPAAPGPPFRSLFTPSHTAYLKVSEGCSNRCSYCMIPSIRGPHRSVPRLELVDEAERLAGAGVKELIVIAQDTTAWGNDLPGGVDIYELLEDLTDIEGLAWIRLMYLHPSGIDAARLSRLVNSTRIIPYLDIPVQHSSDSMLRRMGRRYTGSYLAEIFEELRGSIEDLVIRTTLMTGFPGETRADFDMLLRFVEEQRFDHAGIFRYSPEEGTPASSMPERVPDEEVSERLEELSSLQFEISADILSGMEGRLIDVLVDSREAGVGGAGGASMGRWYGQAPEIDGFTWLENNTSTAGSFVRAVVERSEAYDLFASPA
jgi:ribosomal protein S12 methylthiotransferase